jgi:hypothetical protein
VKGISVYTLAGSETPLPFNAGDVIAQYGPPRRVYLYYRDRLPGNMVLVYPTIAARIDIGAGDMNHPRDFRLQLNSPISELSMLTTDNYARCNDAPSGDLGLWHGFTSAALYLARNLHESSMAHAGN